MSNSEKDRLLNTTAPASTYIEEDDGLSSFSVEQLGKKVGTFGSARIIKFNSGVYKTTMGETITDKREFYLMGLLKVVQKFVGKKLITSFIVPSHDSIPNLEKMNNEAPQEEWGVNPFTGKPQGPWSYILVLKLLDVDVNFDKYVFITNSDGGGMAFGEITDKIKHIRRLKGKNMTAVITCEHGIRFKSSYNPAGVLRPSFHIVKHVRLAGEDDSPTLLPASETKTTQAITAEPSSMETRPSMQAAEQLDTFAGGSEKKEPKYTFLDPVTTPKPPLKDEMNDDLPI
jgi:hypothetical protein